MLFTFFGFAVFRRSPVHGLAFEHHLQAILCLDIAFVRAFVTHGAVLFVDALIFYAPWPFVGHVPSGT
jgi:hypothetical protein